MSENRENLNEKLDADTSISHSSGFIKKIDNFWFHYKWPVIIGAFFLIIFIIGVVQIAAREETDGVVAFAGPANITPNQSLAIQEDLATVMPYDNTGDGKKITKFKAFSCHSEDDAKKIEGGVDTQQNAANYKDFNSYFSSGECCIYFLGKDNYERMVNNGRLQSMSDIFGEDTPEGTEESGFGVKISELGIYELDSFRVLPEDTYVCLSKPLIHGESSKKDNYTHMTEFFKAIVNYSKT